MKVTFTYTPTEEGYKLDMECEDIPKVPNSEMCNGKEYLKCFMAILESVKNTLEAHKAWNVL